MRKPFSLLLALSLACAMLAGCSTGSGVEAPAPAAESQKPQTAETTEPVSVSIIALKGPTAMGMVQFMKQADSGALTDNDYRFEIAAAIDEVTSKLAKGEVDIAAVPANLSSVLYNNTDGGVQVLAVNTLGVLYIVENGDAVHSAEGLRGKTIYASGKGATPEYALNYILSGNGIDPASDVTIEWKAEHAECLAALLAGENAIALLPQPFVTTALTKSETLRVALDLTQEWDALGTDGALITGVVVVRRTFAEQYPAAVSAFLDHYRESTAFVNGSTEEAAQLIEEYCIVPAAVAAKALPACSITFIEGSEMKDKLSGYLGVLLEQNPQAVGGSLPADDFYYSR